MSKKPTKPYVDAINYGKYEKTNKCIYSLRGSKTLAWQASRLLCEETGEGGGLKMDVYLVPPSVFTDVKCNPGTLPDSMPHEHATRVTLYHYVNNNTSNYTGRNLKPYKSLDPY